MARIPEEEIGRLKREVSLERLAEARGVKLKRHGVDLIGLCPFHDDHNPSLVISPGKNLWNCLGACRAGGTSIDWVMRAEGISFRHAVELLREDHLPLAARSSGKPPRISTVPKLPAPVSRDADDRALLLQVVSYYNETLKTTPEALKYLEARGLKSSEMIDRFQLGFANRTLGYRLPEKNRVAGAELRGRLQKLGIYRESGHEHFNGSVVIPIFDASGQVVQMYGRKITPGLREGTPLHLYLPGPHRGVWNEEALAVSKEIILCEALIDALTFWCAGFRHVTASYGINGFTDEHRAALKKYGTKKIFLAYDRDDAGERAAQELAEELLAMGIECYRVQFPKNMDANEYALKVQPAAKALGMLLNKAAWLGKGQRPTVTVIEPVSEKPPAIEEKTEPAAKEKISKPIETTVSEENALPLAAEVAETLPSAPLPSAVVPTIDVPTEIKGEDIFITQGDRLYRIRGLGKNTSHELLRVNVRVSSTNLRGESGFHVDMFDLYSARHRTVFTKQAAEQLGVKEEVVQRDLGHVLLETRRAAGRADQAGARSETGRVGAQRRRKNGRAGPAARSEVARPHPRGLRAVRCGGRRDQQAGELSGGDLAHARSAAGDPGAIEFRRRKKRADGSGAGAAARGAARAVLGDDRAIPLLHGRDRSKKQSAGHRGRGRRVARGLRVETVAERRRADHRLNGKRCHDGAAHHAPVPRRRPGDALPHDDGHRPG